MLAILFPEMGMCLDNKNILGIFRLLSGFNLRGNWVGVGQSAGLGDSWLRAVKQATYLCASYHTVSVFLLIALFRLFPKVCPSMKKWQRDIEVSK